MWWGQIAATVQAMLAVVAAVVCAAKLIAVDGVTSGTVAAILSLGNSSTAACIPRDMSWCAVAGWVHFGDGLRQPCRILL